MINREHDLPIWQAQVLRINRGSVYYQRARCGSRPAIMRRLTGCIWEFPSRLADVARPAGRRGCKIDVVTSRRGDGWG